MHHHLDMTNKNNRTKKKIGIKDKPTHIFLIHLQSCINSFTSPDQVFVSNGGMMMTMQYNNIAGQVYANLSVSINLSSTVTDWSDVTHIIKCLWTFNQKNIILFVL